jgi:two-component system cell cycle sensor histidine kinase/response regulator CckA
MKRLFFLPIRLQLFIIVLIMTMFSFGIIVYSGIRIREEKINESLKNVAILAEILASENVKMVADMQQLMTALVQLPEVRDLQVERIQSVLRNVLSTNPKYSNIFIADRTGRVVASAVSTPLKEISDRRYFKNALATGRFSSGEYIISRFTGKPVISFSYPFKNSHRDVVGVMVMGIDLSYYKALVETLQLPSGSSYLLLDHEGIIMNMGINPLDVVGRQYNPAGFKRMAEGPERDTFVELTNDGKRFISYHKLRLEGEKTPYMYVRAGIPVSSALAQVNKRLLLSLGLLAASLCFVVSLVLFVGKRSIIDRIALLERASKRLAGGDLQVKVSDIVTGGELGQLSLAFDHMTEEISARETALRQSELRYRTLFDQSPDGVVIVDLSGKIVEFNDAACRQLDYSREEFSQLNISDIDPDESPAEVRYRTERIMKEGSAAFDARHKTKRGEIKNTHIITQVIVLNGGPVLYAIWQDITERKRAEETLNENARKYQFLVEATNTGYVIIDGEGRVVDANENYARMTGHDTVTDIIGRRVTEWTADYDLDRNAEEVRKCAERGFVRNLEIDYVDREGRITPIELNANVMQDSALPRIFTICRDITERRQLEEERLKTQKIESIGTLAGGIAHDFNNLLQGIFGYISVAKTSLDQKDRSLAMLEQAEKALHQSVSLTTQLLTFSKGGKPVKKRISLQPVIENAAKFALSGARSSCQMDIEPDLWQVDADDGQLGQVIQNMVLNADQAMPAGGTVVVNAKNFPGLDSKYPQLPKGRYVEISVQDRGIGIPEKYRQKIFDPYFTTKEKGSGLGLATSYSIIRNHGGLVDVTSEVGKGTTFFIYLPAVEMEKEVKETPAAPPVVRKGKILVMDDEEMIRKIAGELIRTLGHDVDFAESGEIAIGKYETAMKSGKPFDVVILDLTIRGGMGGRDAIERLRVIDPGVRAIVSSGYSDDAVVADYKKYGFEAQLTKPYKIEGLKDALNTLLSA